jgi:hypothetical protein
LVLEPSFGARIVSHPLPSLLWLVTLALLCRTASRRDIPAPLYLTLFTTPFSPFINTFTFYLTRHQGNQTLEDRISEVHQQIEVADMTSARCETDDDRRIAREFIDRRKQVLRTLERENQVFTAVHTPGAVSRTRPLGEGAFGSVIQVIFHKKQCPEFILHHEDAPQTVAVKGDKPLAIGCKSGVPSMDTARCAVQARFEVEMLAMLDNDCIIKYFGSWVVRLVLSLHQLRSFPFPFLFFF